MVGDPILYSKKSGEFIIIANICKMKNSNKQIKQIDLSVNDLTTDEFASFRHPKDFHNRN